MQGATPEASGMVWSSATSIFTAVLARNRRHSMLSVWLYPMLFCSCQHGFGNENSPSNAHNLGRASAHNETRHEAAYDTGHSDGLQIGRAWRHGALYGRCPIQAQLPEHYT